MRKLLIYILFFALLVVGIVTLYHTVVLTSQQIEVKAVSPDTLHDTHLWRLSQGLQIPNSTEDSAGRSRIYQWLADAYPALHSNVRIRWQDFPSQTRLYKWEGLNERQRPLLLLFKAGIVEPTLAEVPRWAYNPFLGKITPDEVWGCGAHSGKSAAIAFMEAVERYSAQGTIPNRTIYWAWLQQDKNDTLSSALPIAKAFTINNIKPECIINNGVFVADTMIMELPLSVALIGIAEKRELMLRLIATGNSPEKDISEVLEDWRLRPIPIHFNASAAQPFWDYISPEMPFGRRWIFANRGGIGFGAWAASIVRRDAFTNEMLSNALEVKALFSTAQGQTVSEVAWKLPPNTNAEQVRRWLAAGQRPPTVKAEWISPLEEYVPIAPTSGYGFNVLQTTYRQVFPKSIIAPAIQLEATDARHFQSLQVPIYHCSPLRFNAEQYESESSIDERINIKNYQEMVNFYSQLLQNIIGGK